MQAPLVGGGSSSGTVQLLGNGTNSNSSKPSLHPHHYLQQQQHQLQTGPPKLSCSPSGFFSKVFHPRSATSSYDFGGGRRGALLNSYAYSMERAKRIDVVSRVIFPAIFAIFNLSYWIYYLIRAAKEFELSQMT